MSSSLSVVCASWASSFQSVLPSCGRPSFDLWDRKLNQPTYAVTETRRLFLLPILLSELCRRQHYFAAVAQ